MSNPRLLTRSFVLCWLSSFIQGMSFYLFLHFPGFLKLMGASALEIGWILGVASLVSIGARPWLGSLMDRRGRRIVILWGNIINVVVIGLYLTVSGIGPWVIAIRIIHGLSEAMLFMALFTYAADQVPPRRLTQGLALFGISGMLPMSLAGQLGDVILDHADFSMLFIVATGFAVLALFLALPLRDAPRDPMQAEDPSRGFWSVVAQRNLLPIWWVSTVFTIALAAQFTFLSPFVMHTGVGTVGGFFTGYSGAAILLRVFFGWLPDRVGAKRVLIPALASLAAGYLLMALASTPEEVFAAGILCGIGHGYVFPILFGLVVTRARSADRGSAMAFYTGLFDVGALLGGVSLGFLIDHYGYSAMFVSAGGLVVLGAAIYAIWDGVVRGPTPNSSA